MPRKKVSIEEFKDDDIPPFEVKAEEEVLEELASEEVIQEEKGRVFQISYRTNRQRGNHEHETLELTSTVGATESEEDVFNYLKETAEYLLDD